MYRQKLIFVISCTIFDFDLSSHSFLILICFLSFFIKGNDLTFYFLRGDTAGIFFFQILGQFDLLIYELSLY